MVSPNVKLANVSPVRVVHLADKIEQKITFELMNKDLFCNISLKEQKSAV